MCECAFSCGAGGPPDLRVAVDRALHVAPRQRPGQLRDPVRDGPRRRVGDLGARAHLLRARPPLPERRVRATARQRWRHGASPTRRRERHACAEHHVAVLLN